MTVGAGKGLPTPKSSNFIVEELERLVKGSASKKREAETLVFAVTWRINFRSEVSSGAKSSERSNDLDQRVESANSVAELNTSNTINGARLQTNFGPLD